MLSLVFIFVFYLVLPSCLCFVYHHYRKKKKKKTHQIRNKAILENGGTLKSVPDFYKNQEMCNKAVDNYPLALEFVPECCATQKCMIKQFIDVFLFLILFFNKTKLKKYVGKLFLNILFYNILS